MLKFSIQFIFFIFQPDSKQTMLQCRKDLLHHLETLTKQKHTRMVALKNLIDQEKILCDRTKILPFHISHSTIPSDNDLSEYEKHIEELTIEQVCSPLVYNKESDLYTQ